MPTPEWKEFEIGERWYTGDTIITGIGQGAMPLPLQLAHATALLATRSKAYKPHFLNHI